MASASTTCSTTKINQNMINTNRECPFNIGGKSYFVKRPVVMFLKRLIETSSNEIDQLATELCYEENLFKAILTQESCADLKNASADEIVVLLERCCATIRDAVEASVAVSQTEGIDCTIRHFIIPWMFELLLRMRTLRQADGKLRCVHEAWCLHYIEYCQYLCGEDWDAREKTILLGLESLEQTFRCDASKHQIYGLLLHNMGQIFADIGLYEDSKIYFTKAVGGLEKAEDIGNGDERTAVLETIRNHVELIERKLPAENTESVIGRPSNPSKKKSRSERWRRFGAMLLNGFCQCLCQINTQGH